MTDFEIVKEFMKTKHPNAAYSMRNGNDCIWVSMGMVEMYFIIRNGKIADIQID